MFRQKQPKFEVTIARAALDSIFDECDAHDVNETGGRIIGTYTKKRNRYDIRVLGVLGPGPNARRSPTSFFQDGDYQEQLFRRIEENHRNIEHLGNWHTHHVNGLNTLSSGDLTTYRANVNHRNHNTDFFYALLVTRKRSDLKRYDIKHFFFHRGDDAVYEVPESQARVVDVPALWTRNLETASSIENTAQNESANPERVSDANLFSAFYPGLKSLFSQKVGSLYWKGTVTLVDGSEAEVAALEVLRDGTATYSITASTDNNVVADVLDRFRDRTFVSARHAVIAFERDANRALFRAALRSGKKA